MNAILLAAGAGRKFWPYNEVRNKCAFPVANVPVVRRLAEQLLAAGVGGLTVVVGVRAPSVRAALAGLEDRIRWVEQPRPEGTADAVLRALDPASPEPVIVAYGDLVATQETVSALVAAAARASTPAVAVVDAVESGRTADWITTEIRDGALAEMQGHARRERCFRLSGLFALQPTALPFLRANPGVMTHVPVGGMPPLELELAESLAAMTEAGLAVEALEATGFVTDLDKPWHILEANAAALADRFTRLEASSIAKGARIAESAEIHGRVVLEPGAVIGERVVVQGDLWLGAGASVTNGSIVGAGCAIGARSRVRDYALLGEGTTLGPDTICGHGAEFEGVLLDGAYLYHYCEIYGVLGSRVDIGAATVCGTLRFDDGPATHTVLGRREQPATGANASYLGDYSRTGVNAILMPGVKVGAYSCVGPGVVLNEDLPSREVVLVKQELVRKPWGPERYGW
jgi:bifunctional UDP-N-acetylglucosamine pyrophosphorylase/glucosamine-1-phosphate N-acetyltransferase